MFFRTGFLAAAFAACTSVLSSQNPASAQDGYQLPVLVITADRIPLAPTSTGSAIHVIQGNEIETWGSRSIADVLRGAPGLDITEQGGPGGLSNASIRGAAQGQTLVLVDGIRVGDPAGIAGEFDFSGLLTSNIERIEILRGPQSALYGSDAMGGVINIITKKGAGKPVSSLTVEGGSYGTISSRLTNSGTIGKVSWALSLNGLHTNGYSRYGYRIGRIEQSLVRPLERDKTEKLGGSARISYVITPGAEIEVGFQHLNSRFRFDNPGAFVPSDRDTRFNRGHLISTLLFSRLNFLSVDGKFQNSVTVFSNWTDRFNRLEQTCFDALFNSYNCDTTFKSQRIGAEYQGTLKTQSLGTFVFGLRSEREQALNRESWLQPPFSKLTNFDAAQSTHSAYILDRLSLGRLHLSLGGRVDSIDGKNNFATWRTTAAYYIQETNTTLRASAGTGARAPSLFQRFSQYGTPNLQAEQNFGIEAGLDQNIFDKRLKVSATVFDTRYKNLIDFDFSLNGGLGGYFNVGRARMSGLETSADFILIPKSWRLRAAYTYLRAMDLDQRLPLLRRPKNKLAVSAFYSGIHNLETEARVTFIGARPDVINDFPYGRVNLKPYAKLDMHARYKVNDQLAIFMRAENLTNARYEEIRDYGTMGRSIFAGATFTW